MRTREKILATALTLFNTQGVDPITVRHIAKAMNISHGNLCYHFPKKEDIVQQLYLELVAELDAQIGPMAERAPGIQTLLQSVQLTFATQYKYKFLLIDFVAIMRNIPAVRAHFRQLVQRRRQEFATIAGYLVQAGYFRGEAYPGQYDQVFTQFFVFGDFWIAESEILFEGTDEEKLAFYTHTAYGLVYPHLTEKGQQVFREVYAPPGV
jgi:AcrR family transcriptional regulator